MLAYSPDPVETEPKQNQEAYQLGDMVFGYAMEGSDLPCYILWPTRTAEQSFWCIDAWKGDWVLFFFCWKLLGFIPGGAPFSQLNRGVKDAVSATTKIRCLTSLIRQKTCIGPQVPKYSQVETKKKTTKDPRQNTSKNNKKAPPFLSKATSPEGNCNRRKRALVKPGGSTCARVEKATRKRALVKPAGSTYAGARVVIGIHGECLKTSHVVSGHFQIRGFIEKPNLTQEKKCEERPQAIQFSQVKTW